MPRKGRLRVFLSIILTTGLVTGLAGWFIYQHYRVSWALDARAKLGPGTLIDFAEIAPFPWDMVYFFGPYTSQSTIDEALGFHWPGVAGSSINGYKGSNLIVFTKGKEVVHWFDYSRGKLELPEMPDTGYTPADARYMVRTMKGSDDRLELVDRKDAERWAGPPVPLRSFMLFDLSGFRGGDALWVGEDKTAIIQLVRGSHNGMWEKRYQIQLTPEQWANVERLIGAQHFMSLIIPKRNGVPDEGRVTISITTKSGQTKTLTNFIKDRHLDFDQIYDYLISLCRQVEEIEPIHEGEWNPEWHPEGMDFPR